MLLRPPSAAPGASAWIRTGSEMSGGLGSFVRPNSDTSKAHATTEEASEVLAHQMGMKFMLKTIQIKDKPLLLHDVTTSIKKPAIDIIRFPIPNTHLFLILF